MSNVFPDTLKLDLICLTSASLCKHITTAPSVEEHSELLSRLALSTFPPRTNSQNVTFLPIEEVTLHHKDVARQHPCRAHFLFSVYDNVAMSDLRQQKGENAVDFCKKTCFFACRHYGLINNTKTGCSSDLFDL